MAPDILRRVAETIEARKKADPAGSYVAGLFAKGHDAILKKVAEEAAETLLAAKDGDRLHIVRETADLWFHCLLVLAWHGLGPDDVLAELQRREGISGVEEKKSRPGKWSGMARSPGGGGDAHTAERARPSRPRTIKRVGGSFRRTGSLRACIGTSAI